MFLRVQSAQGRLLGTAFRSVQNMSSEASERPKRSQTRSLARPEKPRVPVMGRPVLNAGAPSMVWGPGKKNKEEKAAETQHPLHSASSLWVSHDSCSHSWLGAFRNMTDASLEL